MQTNKIRQSQMSQMKFTQRFGVDAGYHKSVIRPPNGEGCVGVRGIDKRYTLEQVMELANRMEPKPNIIIKAGPRAKWYLKRIELSRLDDAIRNQAWRDTSRCTMYIMEW